MTPEHLSQLRDRCGQWTADEQRECMEWIMLLCQFLAGMHFIANNDADVAGWSALAATAKLPEETQDDLADERHQYRSPDYTSPVERKRCEACGGRGKKEIWGYSQVGTCDKCRGTGYISEDQQ